jgi:hypothetical protein
MIFSLIFLFNLNLCLSVAIIPREILGKEFMETHTGFSILQF